MISLNLLIDFVFFLILLMKLMKLEMNDFLK